MVGRQTSCGCATCRRRKVKCDLALPACSACIKFGAACPGYFDRFVAVGSQQLMNKKAKVQRNQEIAAGRLPAATIFSASDLLRAEFVTKLESDRLAAQLCMIPATNILSHVASRIGESRVLDHAVRCIAHGANSWAYGGEIESRRLYGIALSSLRHAVEDPILWRRPETTAAATLLQMYEHYHEPGSKMASYHAYGASKMLQARGIDNLNDDLEAAILEAQAGCLFLAALTIQEHSFLAHPAWSVAQSPSTSVGKFLDKFVQTILYDASLPETDTLIDDICAFRGEMDASSKERLTSVALSDALRIRKHLKLSLDAHLAADISVPPEHHDFDSMQIAVGFFLFFTDSAILSLLKNLKWKPACTLELSPYLDENPKIFLENEREWILAGLKTCFPNLRETCPNMHLLAPGVFRVISGTIMGLSQAGHGEKEILLALLDHADQSRWPWGTDQTP